MKVTGRPQLLLATHGMPADARATLEALAQACAWTLRCDDGADPQAGREVVVVAMARHWRGAAGGGRPCGVLLLAQASDPVDAASWRPPEGCEALQPWPCRPDDLLARLLEVLASVPLCLDAGSRTVLHGGRSVRLTPKECRILEVLLAHPGEAVAREVLEAALHAWGQEFESNTLDVHVHRLRRKLPKAGIRAIRGYGYALIADH